MTVLEEKFLKSNKKIKEFIDSKAIKEISKEIKEITSHMKIEWAPINIPPRRRIQTLAAGIYVYVFMFLPFVSMLLAALFVVSKICERKVWIKQHSFSLISMIYWSWTSSDFRQNYSLKEVSVAHCGRIFRVEDFIQMVGGLIKIFLTICESFWQKPFQIIFEIYLFSYKNL